MEADVWSLTWPTPTITWALHAARGDVEAAQREYHQRAIDLDTEGFYRQRAEKALEELTGQ